jgi:hypothetical protein
VRTELVGFPLVSLSQVGLMGSVGDFCNVVYFYWGVFGFNSVCEVFFV